MAKKKTKASVKQPGFPMAPAPIRVPKTLTLKDIQGNCKTLRHVETADRKEHVRAWVIPRVGVLVWVSVLQRQPAIDGVVSNESWIPSDTITTALGSKLIEKDGVFSLAGM